MSKEKSDKKLQARNNVLSQRKKRQHAPKDSSPPIMPFLNSPTFVDLKAPKGFRTVTISQALSEFSEPLMEHMNGDDFEELNTVMNLGIQIWNFSNPEAPEPTPRVQMIEQVGQMLEMDEIDAIDLFEQMLSRKAHLFPEDIQPHAPMTMFMRKEVDYRIKQFDETQMNYSEESIPPDAEDQKMIDDLNRLDAMLADGEDYDEWEKLYLSLEEFCCDRYFAWLTLKGVSEEYCRMFPFCIQTYLDFVYRYNAESLDQLNEFDLEDFLRDHLLRKVLIKPNDYVCWPPALRLFYTFLAEKGYLETPKLFIELLNELEPEFIDILKEHY